ncbi:MAG: hypothetical protein KF678_03900 [Phycisphaeraceae bacterium]|nr:hypothetical protein [Phycisphaeraceae bacterium]
MITPAPTTKIDPSLARGTLTEIVAPTATKPGFLKITFPNTSYELHLLPVVPPRTPVGKKIHGLIRAKARRIDTVQTGGRYVEPVFGRPRRVQGTVVSVSGGEVLVNAGVPIHITPTDPRQKAADFQPGQFISFDVLDGATFEEKTQ